MLLYIYISVTTLIFLILVSLIIYFNQQEKKHKQQARKNPNVMLFQSLYIFYTRFKLTRNYFLMYRKRYEIVTDYDEFKIRKTTAKQFTIVIAVIIITLVAVYIITKSIVTLFLTALGIMFLADSFMGYFITNVKNKIMEQQLNLNAKIRESFYETGAVQDAIYDASENLLESDPEIARQGMIIFDVLDAKESEEEMYGYYETAPNNYLKMLMGLAYGVKEYGDTEHPETKSSMFLNSLGTLTEEIRIEVMKIRKINTRMASLSIICLTPLLMMSPIKNWAIENYKPMGDVYDSSMGLMLQIAVYVVIGLCYFMVRRISKATNEINQSRKDSKYFERFVEIAHVFMPPKISKSRKKVEKLLKDSFANITMEKLYLKKVLTMTITFVVSLIIVVVLHQYNLNSIRNELVLPDDYNGASLSASDTNRAEELAKEDLSVIEQVNKDTTVEQIQAILNDKTGVTTDHISAQADRIKDKLDRMSHEYLKWYEVLICAFIAFIAYMIPTLELMIQRNIIKYESENEVSQYQSIILMLMNQETMGTYDVLEWLERYSLIFKKPIEKILSNYESGAGVTIDEVMDEVDNISFQKLLNNIKNASDNLTLKESFSDLEKEKRFYFEQRKEENEIIVQEKSAKGQFYGMLLPVNFTLFAYVITPMVIGASGQMDTFFTQI